MTSIDTLTALVDAVYEAGLDGQRWPDTLIRLTAASGANVADLTMIESSSGASAVFSAGMDPAAIEAYNRHFSRLDPIRPVAERLPAGTIVTDQDIVSKAWLTRTEFFNDWVRPQDFYDCTMVTVFREPTRLGVICLAAPERADAFYARSSELLAHLLPHLARATRITVRMTELEALRRATFEALDCLSEGVVLADANARIIYANHAAEAMFRNLDGIGVDASGLRAASPAQTMALRRLIAMTARRENVADTGGSLLLERPSGRRPLSVTVIPVRREADWCSAAQPMALVFLVDPERDAKLPQSHLRALYGMTRSEAVVATLISEGSGVKNAARTLGIAPSTVRTHLHRIYEKTGTTRQAELAHLLNQIAPVSAPFGK